MQRSNVISAAEVCRDYLPIHFFHESKMRFVFFTKPSSFDKNIRFLFYLKEEHREGEVIRYCGGGVSIRVPSDYE